MRFNNVEEEEKEITSIPHKEDQAFSSNQNISPKVDDSMTVPLKKRDGIA